MMNRIRTAFESNRAAHQLQGIYAWRTAHQMQGIYAWRTAGRR